MHDTQGLYLRVEQITRVVGVSPYSTKRVRLPWIPLVHVIDLFE